MIKCLNYKGDIVSIPKEKFFFRPSVYGLIRKEDAVLTVRIHSNGKLWFPGGGIDKGEEHEEALKREFLEEIGYKSVEVGQKLGSFENYYYHDPTDEAMHAFLHFYQCFTDETSIIDNADIQDEAVGNVQWTLIKSIRKEDFGDLNEELFELVQNLE